MTGVWKVYEMTLRKNVMIYALSCTFVWECFFIFQICVFDYYTWSCRVQPWYWDRQGAPRGRTRCRRSPVVDGLCQHCLPESSLWKESFLNITWFYLTWLKNSMKMASHQNCWETNFVSNPGSQSHHLHNNSYSDVMIKMTVRWTMVRSEVYNSWCFCLGS